MSQGGAAFYGHVVPKAEDQRLLDNGWYDANPGKRRKMASGGWFRNGAFVVDSEGAGIVDADGVRHALPLPPAGGQLVYVTNTFLMNNQSVSTNYLVVADAGSRVLFRLPVEGVSEELAQAFAQAAGLRFLAYDPDSRDNPQKIYGSFQARGPYSEMCWSRVDQEHTLGNRLRRLFGKKRPEV